MSKNAWRSIFIILAIEIPLIALLVWWLFL